MRSEDDTHETDEAWQPIAVCAWRVFKTANKARKERANAAKGARQVSPGGGVVKGAREAGGAACPRYVIERAGDAGSIRVTTI